ncbi:MAG: class I SAM-dependent methyltransferase [Betaproteobacteria bacterium]|nr:class I SAM-dependent methyltransferase [Betaproteobacteria bacterium]
MDVNDTPDYKNATCSADHHWSTCAAGAHAMAWQQLQIDQWVADVFGYHALQLGMPQLQGLRHNRMPHRWLLSPQALDGVTSLPSSEQTPGLEPLLHTPLPVVCAEFHALPFESNSLDLVVMPHTLEASVDAHQTLREAERVLRPEGRLLVTGFNPASLWGMAGRARRLSGRHTEGALPSVLANVQDWVGYWRLRDWLHLLSFEVEGGRFGCYTPPMGHQAWLQRLAWMEPLGDRWWPVLGGLYAVMAVKRVRGMRLLGLSRQAKGTRSTSQTVVTQRHHPLIGSSPQALSAAPEPVSRRPSDTNGR